MLERLLANLSLRRSIAGVYYELRTLRQMAEILFEQTGWELPRDRKRRVKDAGPLPVDPKSEEELAREAANRIQRDRLAGRDAGTSWEEDPNR